MWIIIITQLELKKNIYIYILLSLDTMKSHNSVIEMYFALVVEVLIGLLGREVILTWWARDNCYSFRPRGPEILLDIN